MRSTTYLATLFAAASVLGACGDNLKLAAEPEPDAQPDAPTAPDTTALLKSKVKTIVVIYAENRGFDNIYGLFPGANGIPGVNPSATGTIAKQIDRDAAGTVLPTLPLAWGGVTAAGAQPVITQDMSRSDLPNAPYEFKATYGALGFAGTTTITHDLVHRFFNNQMQINGGKNDRFASFSDVGGLVMGYHDGSDMELWKVAQHYVLADNFFIGAFGGSFLNHQYLICACAPEYPNADTAAAKPTISVVQTGAQLLPLAPASPASALDGPPVYLASATAGVSADANLTPKNYFGDGTFRAVNTMQPAYQPSGNAPAASDATKLYADPSKPNTLPPQVEPTIGDRLDAQNVTWKWYAGAFTSTTAAATTDRAFPPVTAPGVGPNYQFHHHPFNYYAKFDPTAGAAARQAHFDDETKLEADIAAGTLPAVVFYKPQGDLNQHAGYASVDAGDKHIADLIAKLEASPQFANMVIVVTYDENGGWWDHVAPPKADLLGPGSRIPAIIISPFARAGTVDHTQYDTGSILRLINRRYDLAPLAGITARDAALVTAGGHAMGDLTNALDLTK
jgi:acid phosphatase